MWGDLHEEKKIEICLPDIVESGKGNRLLRELGASLHYDVYSFQTKEHEEWQSNSLLFVELFCSGKPVDAQDNFDEIHLKYLLATRPSSDQGVALSLASRIIETFDGKATYKGKPYTPELVQENWDGCNSYLLSEWGEEPGSKSLRIMIEENHA